jgi:hypothetical protein
MFCRTILHRIITQKSYNISFIVEKALDKKLQTVGILASKDFHSICKIRQTLGSVVRAYGPQVLLVLKFARMKLVLIQFIMFHAVFVKMQQLYIISVLHSMLYENNPIL